MIYLHNEKGAKMIEINELGILSYVKIYFLNSLERVKEAADILRRDGIERLESFVQPIAYKNDYMEDFIHISQIKINNGIMVFPKDLPQSHKIYIEKGAASAVCISKMASGERKREVSGDLITKHKYLYCGSKISICGSEETIDIETKFIEPSTSQASVILLNKDGLILHKPIVYSGGFIEEQREISTHMLESQDEVLIRKISISGMFNRWCSSCKLFDPIDELFMIKDAIPIIINRIEEWKSKIDALVESKGKGHVSWGRIDLSEADKNLNQIFNDISFGIDALCDNVQVSVRDMIVCISSLSARLFYIEASIFTENKDDASIVISAKDGKIINLKVS